MGDAASKLTRLQGFTIVHVGTVTGYIDENGDIEDHFEGCDFGRVLIIDYNLSVTCQSYGYTYAYMPGIVVFEKKGVLKALINDQLFDITAD